MPSSGSVGQNNPPFWHEPELCATGCQPAEGLTGVPVLCTLSYIMRLLTPPFSCSNFAWIRLAQPTAFLAAFCGFQFQGLLYRVFGSAALTTPPPSLVSQTPPQKQHDVAPVDI